MENTNSPAPVSSSVPESVTPETSLENTEIEALEGEESSEESTPLTVSEKKKLKKLKLKVDGEEFDEELPFEIDEDQAEYFKKHLQLSKMSQKRAAKASQIEKETYEFLELLRTDPKRILSDPAIGIDIKKFAAEIIESEIEQSRKSPEQIEKEKMEAELKALKDEREKEKEGNRKRDFERLQKQEFERYDMLMTRALESNPDLPKSPYVIKKIAENLMIALENGMDVGPADVIPLVREEIREDLKQMFAAMPDDVIEQLVGKDKIGSIRKKYVNKAKAAVAAKKQDGQGSNVETKQKGETKKQTFSEFFKF